MTPEGAADLGAHTLAHDQTGAGMPQLDFNYYPNLIFWLVIALVAIYFILSRFALPRIGAVLAERSGTITNDLAAAEELRGRAADAEKAYDKALADARTEANAIVAEAKAEIQVELDAEMAKADARIAEKTAESEAAIAEIKAGATENVSIVARDVAREIVTALGGEADGSAVDQAVDDKMGARA
nr:F0F1 ATP synthase subunit B' [Pseudoroseicyclus aestuarii]